MAILVQGGRPGDRDKIIRCDALRDPGGGGGGDRPPPPFPLEHAPSGVR